MEPYGLFELHTAELQELSRDEKKEVNFKIDALFEGLQSIETQAKNLESGSTRELLLRNAEELKHQASKVKHQLVLSHGQTCFNPDELQKNFAEDCSHVHRTDVEARLIQNCQAAGLRFFGVTPGNGNCFFEAVSSQLSRLQLPSRNAEQLRSEVVFFIEENYVLQGPDGPIQLKDFVPDSDLEKYTRKMAKDGEYADHVAVLAMAHMLQTDMAIVTSSPQTRAGESILWIRGANDFAGDPLLLGHFWENHYQSLEPDISHDEKEQLKTTPMSNSDLPRDEFIEFVKMKYVKEDKKTDCIVRQVKPDEDEHDVMASFIMELDAAGQGLFCRRHENKTTIQFLCERSGKPKGKKRGPQQTRANQCKAYVSFRFISHQGKKAVVIRRQMTHTGHDLTNLKEKHSSRPDPALVSFIESLADQGKKPMDIISRSWKWARGHGKMDFNDRRYYISLADVQNICKSYRMRCRQHKEDVVAVHEMCTTILKNEIVYYQELQEEKKQPLVIVYQNVEQRQRMQTFGKNVVFLDATYKGITAYGYAFYTMLARDEYGRGSPLAYMITSEDSSLPIQLMLESLKKCAADNGFTFSPRSFMIDRDAKEIAAIRQVFPESSILLCWFHVLQAVYRFLNKRESGVSGNQHSQTRKAVIEHLRKMKTCTKKEDFDEYVSSLDEDMPTPEVTRYLRDNWCSDEWSAKWSNYGRRFFHEDHETNNLVERFFLGLKYNFLGGYSNQRIEDLLLLLHGNVADFYNYIEELGKAGRLVSRRQTRGGRGKIRAENMLLAGFEKKILWKTDFQAIVPSETKQGTDYNVDILRALCDCPASTQEGMCKHVHLCIMIASLREINVHEGRLKEAAKIIEQQAFHIDRETNQIEILPPCGEVSFVNIETKACSCIAFSHGIECICISVMNTISAHDEAEALNFQDPVDTEITTKQDLNQQIREQISMITSIAASTDLEALPEERKKSILNTSTTLYKLFQLTKYHKMTSKRKAQPLYPSRSSKSPKAEIVDKVKISDHAYSCSEGKKPQRGPRRNPDGGFKKTGRKKNGLRKAFK